MSEVEDWDGQYSVKFLGILVGDVDEARKDHCRLPANSDNLEP